MAGTGKDRRGVGALLSLVLGLGILIVAGFVVVVVTLIHRALAPDRAAARDDTPAAVAATLAEPPGTRIASFEVAPDGSWIGVLLRGGDRPDRVVLVDPRQADNVLATVSLAPGVSAAQAGPATPGAPGASLSVGFGAERGLPPPATSRR